MMILNKSWLTIAFSTMWKCLWISWGEWLVQIYYIPEDFGFRHWISDNKTYNWEFWRIANVLITKKIHTSEAP